MDSENKKNALNTLTPLMEQISSLDAKQLASRPELGEVNFVRGIKLFMKSIELICEFKSLPLDLLPYKTITSFQEPINNLAKIMNQISTFSLKGVQNPEGQRDSLLNQAQQNYDAAYQALTPHLAYLSLKSAEVQETMRRSKELLSETETRIAEDLKLIKDMSKEVEKIVQATKDAAQKIGVAQFATKFEDLSNEHDAYGQKWLYAASILAFSTVLAAIVLLWLFPPVSNISDPAIVQKILSKIIIISFLYFASLWAAKNYKSHRHLSVVNKHRQSALSTFETFVNAAADQETKNAVLLEATHCIFSPTISGYLGSDEENPGSRIIEVLKTFNSNSIKG